jgi:hypothetical protein
MAVETALSQGDVCFWQILLYKYFAGSSAQHLFASECRGATSIRRISDPDSISAPVVTSYDFCNTIGTSATLPVGLQMSAFGGFADEPRKAPDSRV